EEPCGGRKCEACLRCRNASEVERPESTRCVRLVAREREDLEGIALSVGTVCVGDEQRAWGISRRSDRFACQPGKGDECSRQTNVYHWNARQLGSQLSE